MKIEPKLQFYNSIIICFNISLGKTVLQKLFKNQGEKIIHKFFGEK